MNPRLKDLHLDFNRDLARDCAYAYQKKTKSNRLILLISRHWLHTTPTLLKAMHKLKYIQLVKMVVVDMKMENDFDFRSETRTANVVCGHVLACT